MKNTLSVNALRNRRGVQLCCAMLFFALLLPARGFADTSAADGGSAGALLADAERAMSDGDYTAGVKRYVRAAASGDAIETARQATLVAFEFGFDSLAIEASERWAMLSQTPDDARLLGALAALRAGNTGATVDALKGIIRRSDQPQTVCDGISEHLAPGTRAEYVSVVFRSLAREFKDVACVQRLAASSAIAVRDYDRADDYIRQLEKTGNFDNETRLLAMATLIQQEQYDAAFTDAGLRLDDDATVEQRIELAFLNARAEEVENAVNMLGLLRSEYPDDPDVLVGLSVAQLQAGDTSASRAGFLELLASGKKTADALYYLARFAERERRTEQAIRMYSQVDIGGLALAAQRRVAALIMQREGVPAAIAHIDGFTQRHPRYGLELSTVSASLYAEGEFYEQALTLYDAYLAVRPNAEFALLARADVLLRDDKLDDAIDAFRGVVKMFPDSANALNALGYTLADRTRKYREAERLIDRALELEPDNAAIIDSKGWVLFKRGKLQEAREYLQRAWDEFRDPEVAAHLGETLWRLGEEEAARELLEEAWQRYPDDETLRDTVRRLIQDGPATRS